MSGQYEENKSAGLDAGERINEFIQRNRKPLVFCLIAVLAAVAGLILFFSIQDKLSENAWSRVEDFNRRYEALEYYIGGASGAEDVSKQADISALKEELAAFAERNSGFPAARAWGLLAGIYGGEKNWAGAEKAWISAAAAANQTYFAPVSFFNAAAAAEEQGNKDRAVELYRQVLSREEEVPGAAPRAQFAIGRIQETQGSKDAAIESYRTILSRWPGDPLWTKLAWSRILVLQEAAQ